MVLLLWIVFSLLMIALFMIAVFDLLKSTFKDSTTKPIWLIVILFVPVVGPFLYLFLGRKEKVKIA